MVMPDHRLQLRLCPVMQYGEALADDADKLLERLITPAMTSVRACSVTWIGSGP